MPHVLIYTKSTCPYCFQAKKLFNSLDIEFEELSVDHNPELREKIRHMYRWPTVPVIVIKGEFIGGYDELARLHSAGRLLEKLNV